MMRRPSLVLAALAVVALACSRANSPNAGPPTPAEGTTITGDVSLAKSPALRYPESAKVPNPDPRIGLKPGEKVGEAGEAAFHMKLLANVPAPEGFTGRGATGSVLAFSGNYIIQGNYRGFIIWDATNPRSPKMVSSFLCPTQQGDPTIYGNLLFISGEGQGARNDCGSTPITDTVSMERFRGVRIFDISDKAKPRLVTNVQTCRGSHTNSLVEDPNDRNNIYIYVSGYSAVRSSRELAGCQDAAAGDSASARFRIEVIKVRSNRRSYGEFAAPARRSVGRTACTAAEDGRARWSRWWRGGPLPAGAPAVRTGSRCGRRRGAGQCGQSSHDITPIPAAICRRACAGYGCCSTRDPKNPKRLRSVADSNCRLHSATFSNDGSKLLFSDEWGGGSAPRCRATDKLEWGGNAIFTLENGELKFKSYYKMPAPQTNEEICTAHNGSLIPVPGRDIMVQAFYMGGATIFDFTDASHPIEIGFFDRGPGGGYWSTYWFNGHIISSDEQRGLDIHELTPSPYLSQNEIDAAKSVKSAVQPRVRPPWGRPSRWRAPTSTSRTQQRTVLVTDRHIRNTTAAERGGWAVATRRRGHRAAGAGRSATATDKGGWSWCRGHRGAVEECVRGGADFVRSRAAVSQTGADHDLWRPCAECGRMVL